MVTNTLDLLNDPFFNTFTTKTTNYPPYNHIKLDDRQFVLTFALAGFSKDDVSVSLDNRTLKVQGERREIELPEGAEYIHRGIAARKFTNIFTLPDFVEVVQAEFKDGMLSIGLERQVPEDKLPKQIQIK